MDQFMQSKTNHSSPPPLTSASANGGQAYVRIVEQPAKCALRFRYECEGRSAGSIPGSKATADNKTYPTIQVCNYRGQAVVVVSCVTKDQPYRPHPHNLVGKEGCKKGVCTMVINNQDMLCSFTSLGIQCVKRKDIEDSLKLRESIKVDPFRTGFSHKSQSSSIDLNVVRLCFQVFIEGPEKDKFTVQLPPIVSEPIYDKKAMTELIVTKLSHCSAPCNGGKEVILLCDRVTKDDVQVRFYQEMNGALVWESYADFSPGDVHKQVAICFRTPRYFNENITQPVSVQLQLRRPSDGCLSDPRGFQLLPKEVDPDGLTRKRQKIEEGCLERFLRENAHHLGVSTGSGGQSPVGAGIAVSPVSPKRPEVIHVPRMTPAIKLEPLTTSIDSQQMTSSAATTSWAQPSPPQFMPLSPSQQQIRPQMDVLLPQQQDYRQQLSPVMSQCSTQSEFLIPNIPIDSTASKSMTTTLTTLLPVVGNGLQSLAIETSTGVFETITNNINQNSTQLNANYNNNETISDEVMEKFDSLGLDIDSSELLNDINFNSMSMMSVLMDSNTSICNSRENLLNSRDNILVSSSLQTPDVQTSGGPEEHIRNLMANPQQMQRLQQKLIQMESNNNFNNNIVINNNTTNDKINNN